MQALENIFHIFFRYLDAKGNVFNFVIGMAWEALHAGFA